MRARTSVAAFRLALEKDRSGGVRLGWHSFRDGESEIHTTEPYTSFWRRFGAVSI
jgi:hypothetical protein